MFDTEKFIFEVRARKCLWDCRDRPDRMEKKRAWEEIGKLFNDTWDEETETKQEEIVEELQRRWKHLRDYYVRERKRAMARGETSVVKKRKSSTVDMLQFLDVLRLKEPQPAWAGGGSSPDNERSCDEPPYTTDWQHTVAADQAEQVAGTSRSKRKSETPLLQPNLNPTANSIQLPIQQPAKDEDDADAKFLLSLLPQMKSLNERQNCEFRIEVMNLMYKIKYPCAYSTAHAYHRPGCSAYEAYTAPARSPGARSEVAIDNVDVLRIKREAP